MPALWQSSQRPMYIRTVWVDGFRHPILHYDDPCYIKLSAKRRPYSSASTHKATTKIQSGRLSHRHEDLEDCLRKLRLVITNEKSFKGDQEPRVEKLNLSDVDDSDDELRIKASPQHLNDFDTSRFDNVTMKAIKSNRTSRTDSMENTELSDRVLQWLDLAGKIDLLKEDTGERMSQPRHSWPEIQKRNLIKSKTSADLKAKESKPIEQKLSGPIDRNEFNVPTSNTIENYARQSRNVKSTLRHDTRIKENRRAKDVKRNIAETRQKVVTERNAVEKQYAELVSKKLIPDVGKVKKQVHIFMPEALSKRTDSNVTSRTQSLLSQKI
ncbi:uncharacterized protein LOC119838715 [Zerene cesonia]|uniref:uncharacterized protein LOC119838715 n=1 Tax=Zerene cesonia TaxID=33412 RepID=UPI0018E4FECD|nr:uncharacterized protein LOC119838715 [Zerene cesonia]